MKAPQRARRSTRQKSRKQAGRAGGHRQIGAQAKRRSERARAHLDRVRLERDLHRPAYRWVVVIAVLLAVVCGHLYGSNFVQRMQRGLESADGLLQIIAVQGNRQLSTDEIASATGIAKDTPANAVDVAAIEAHLAGHPWIAEARALQLPNGELIVSIDEREPKAALRAGDASWHLVDAGGTPFVSVGSEQPEGLPRLISRQIPAPGVPNEQLERAVALAEAITRSGTLKPADLAFSASLQLPQPDTNEGWVLYTSLPDRRVIFGEGDLDQQLDRLTALLATDLEPMSQASEIDLRFAGRAVLRSASVSR